MVKISGTESELTQVIIPSMFIIQGSVIGGFLAQPASKFGPLKIPFFCEYPYSLPCIVGASLAVFSFIGKVYCLYLYL